MKLKKVIIPNYVFRDELGEFLFHNVNIIVDINSDITPESFSQEKDDFSISSTEIDKMGREAAQRYFNDKYKKVIKGGYKITPNEFNGMRLFLNVNGTGLAKLLNLDKSSISRIISEKQEIQRDTMLLIMEKIGNEIETPGITKLIVEKLESDDNQPIEDMGLIPGVIAEWIIRRFVELEECITNLKLQKLLYYVQGIGVGRYHTKVISEDFYAWEHGPVIESIYHQYKEFGAGALLINPETDIKKVLENQLALRILDETINTYGKFSAWVLRDKTHCESPWLNASEGEKIEIEAMRIFFRGILI